ncbi:hypothetical protein [Streptomyces adustus]|uniref:hypothetical protein n=1 Tax=Streptomyces adustus TaxID=1609272 RepID=UPI00371F85BA
MTSNVRRAAGTQTFSDVLLRWLWIKRPTPAGDLDLFANGVTLKVTCFLRPLGQTGPISRLGTLHLTHGKPVIWQGRGQELTLLPPLALTASAVKTGHWKLTALDLTSPSGSFTLKMPKLDVTLVRHAFDAQAS